MNALLENPWVAARIEQALAPYVGRLPASELAWMRDQLAETLTKDETAAGLLRAAMPREVDRSGEIANGVEGANAKSAADKKKQAR